MIQTATGGMKKSQGKRSTRVAALFGLLAALWYGAGFAYPLDGYEATGINRLEGYRLALEGEVAGKRIFAGAILPTKKIDLYLKDAPHFKIPRPDPGLSRTLRGFLGSDLHGYGVTLPDLTDIDNPRYAEVNAGKMVNPGSVGKLLVLLGIFHTLADIYPDDVPARIRVLKNTLITADQFIRTDSHTVPIWKPGDRRITKRPIRQGDRANLYTFMDWMASNSSNAAASMVMKQLVLLQRYRRDYPRPEEEMNTFLATAKKGLLRDMLVKGLQEPVLRNGLDLKYLRQGSLFTRQGKRMIPGTSSHANSRELMRYLVLMEQGKLVDPWSSLEIKKMIYLTDTRIRYASSPALRHSAVYFKSGSLYKCRPEPGFVCRKYHGNVRNMMNSTAIVASQDREPPLYYMAVITSNVLYRNSAKVHQSLATRIHRLIDQHHPATFRAKPSYGILGGKKSPARKKATNRKPKKREPQPKKLRMSPSLGGIGLDAN